MARITEAKTKEIICREWDVVNPRRQTAIKMGLDISLSHVTAPCIMRHIINDKPNTVLDIGCGTGYLTYEISKLVDSCVGIDMSEKSIACAQKNYKRENLSFIRCIINNYQFSGFFDACVANMVFSSDPIWQHSLTHIIDFLPLGGKLYFTIPHPFFWAKYWKYENEPWYCYSKELFIENNFSLSLVPNLGISTFIHRPLSHYINSLIHIGFSIEAIEEPYPVGDIPSGYCYDYPRFLFIKCIKAKQY